MSYIVGWKRNGVAFVCADSAVTVEARADALDAGFSSFGERQIFETLATRSRSVQEGALKIVHVGKAIVAYCGRVHVALSFIQTFSRTLLTIEDVGSALSRSIDQLHRDYNDPNVTMLVAFPGPTSAELFAYNVDGDRTIAAVPDGTAVHSGSLGLKHRAMTRDFLLGTQEFFKSPASELATAIGYLQSYVVTDYTMEHGVGGPFCGAMIDQTEIRWQPDLLFVFPGDPGSDCVASIVRDHVHVVRSTLNRSCVYFANSVNGGLNQEWCDKWYKVAFDWIERLDFEFVVFPSVEFHTVTVVETRHEQNLLHLQLEKETTPNGFSVSVGISVELERALNNPPPEQKADGATPSRLKYFSFKRRAPAI